MSSTNPTNPTRVLNDAQPNVPRQQVQPKAEPVVPPSPPPEPEYSKILLTLADEYVDCAYSSTDRSEDFHKLIATALGCMQAVLENFQLDPLLEAQLTAKYVQILLDETEDYDEAEKVATRAVEICERNRFFDLKYTLQMLEVQILHKSRPKAAIKALDEIIEGAELEKHTAWSYGLRFLQAGFSLVNGSYHDLQNAAAQLQRIATSARRNEDHVMYAFASLTETLIYLKTNTPESQQQAQSSLASARALQLNPEVAENPQMQVMMEFADFICTIQQFQAGQLSPDTTAVPVTKKLESMQSALYQILESASWSDDGVIQIPVGKRSLGGASLQRGGLLLEQSKKFYLTFGWIRRTDIEVLGFLLSAVSVSYKNGSDGGKAERFMKEGLKMLQQSRNDETSLVQSRLLLEDEQSLLSTVECHLLIEQNFLLCAKGAWKIAIESHAALETLLKDVNKSDTLHLFALYIRGVIQQGTGDTTAALITFDSPAFSLNPEDTTTKSSSGMKSTTRPKQLNRTSTKYTLSLLALINTAFILRLPSHPRHAQLESILDTLKSHIHAPHINPQIRSAHDILLAVLNEKLIKSKECLSKALKLASATANAQLTTLTLAVMSDRYFKGAVAAQAVKCMKAGSSQARGKLGSPLWRVVTMTMERDCLELQGMGKEARVCGEETVRLWEEEVPVGVREGLGRREDTQMQDGGGDI